ncbi:MAG: hypothetical protein C0631_15220 [Sedimenticola sp.]|jgi:hypothetical protein|nr:MAG: hypothetical protein C0631_15220 [Sedimenticola sp.]
MDPSTPDQLPCWIYRSSLKQEMYLYLAHQDAFEQLPPALLKGFGKPQFVMQLQLHPALSLAREDTTRVMASLRDQGFFLQMPPKLEPYLYEGEQRF